MIRSIKQAGPPCPLAASPGAASEHRVPGVQGWNPCGYGAWMRRLLPVRTRPLGLSGPDITSHADRFSCQLKWNELPVEIIHDNNRCTGVINYVD